MVVSSGAMSDAEMAAMLREEIASLTAILNAEGLVCEGHNGQPVAHWALAQRRASTRLLHVIQNRMAKNTEADEELEAFLAET